MADEVEDWEAQWTQMLDNGAVEDRFSALEEQYKHFEGNN